jgi:hypothetical protein
LDGERMTSVRSATFPNRQNTTTVRKQKLRQHAKHKTKYDVQAKRTEANKLARAKRNKKRQTKANMLPPKAARPVEARNESPTQRDIRHKLHEMMLYDHVMRKASAKEAHNKRLHRLSITPIQLV